jgi:2-oxoglutarate ferredoxin oxidoreductase subunit beta
VTKSTPFGSLDTAFNPVSLALGAEASFVARTHDMDRKHMQETFRRAHAHRGSAFVEIYQNCNVFNDGAFEAITGKEQRASMLIPLVHGQPVRFGDEGERCVVLDAQGHASIADVAEVDESEILVHDEARDDPALAFTLSRLATGPHEPTPIGVFRAVERPEYATEATQQIAAAQERSGPGDLHTLLHSGATWTVEGDEEPAVVGSGA